MNNQTDRNQRIPSLVGTVQGSVADAPLVGDSVLAKLMIISFCVHDQLFVCVDS